MARFDLYRSRLNEGYLVDCQADALSTRLVVPLLPQEQFPQFDRRLNPIIKCAGERFVLATQAAVSVPIPQLGKFPWHPAPWSQLRAQWRVAQIMIRIQKLA